MNIYMILNLHNIRHRILPYFYIGSDSNDREEYYGSSVTLKLDILKLGKQSFTKIYLWRGTKGDLKQVGYNKLTELENKWHTKYNVVSNPKYYNKATACGGFETTGFGNFFYLSDTKRKIINLPIDHPDVICGLAVGMQTGNQFFISKESLDKRRETSLERYGCYPPSKNNLIRDKLSKPKSEETKQKMRKPKSEETKQKMRKPKSETHKANMSRNHKNNAEIIQYDLNHNALNKYQSIKDAALNALPSVKYLTARTKISECCRNIIPEYKDYIWKYNQ